MFTQTVAGLTQMLDAYAKDSDAWLCLEADMPSGPFGERVLLQQPSAGDLPTNNLDSPQVPAPPATPGPAGVPSTSCQNGSGNVQALDANITGAQVWLYGWQESATKTHLCVRVQNPAQNPTQSAGGELTVDASGGTGITPVGPSMSNDPTPCTVQVYHANAEGVDITIKSSAVTPTPANPASLCVISPSLPQPIVLTAGFTGSPTPPHVSWTADPGTPGGSIGNLNLL
jgi:hypothetical protein